MDRNQQQGRRNPNQNGGHRGGRNNHKRNNNQPGNQKKDKEHENNQNFDYDEEMQKQIDQINASNLDSNLKDMLINQIKLKAREEIPKNRRNVANNKNFDEDIKKAKSLVEKKKGEKQARLDKILAKDFYSSNDRDEIEILNASVKEIDSILQVFDRRIKNMLNRYRENAQDEYVETEIKIELKRLESSLPIYSKYEKLRTTIEENNVMLLKGETGCGKSTQIPSYLYDMYKYLPNKYILCTQPRKLAATTIAKRVANDTGLKYGSEIKYLSALNEQVDPKTKIVFTTDRNFVDLLLRNSNLDRISAIMIDEAHERNLHSDFLLSILKKLTLQFNTMKIIICSATLDNNEFSKFFENPPMLEIPGRTYPIKVNYENPEYLRQGYIGPIKKHVKDHLLKCQKKKNFFRRFSIFTKCKRSQQNGKYPCGGT